MNDPTFAPAQVLRIEGEMTIYRAVELWSAIRRTFEKGGDIELDLSEVSELDSSGVQLLIAAQQRARAVQRELRLVGHSPAVLEVFETLGLAALLGAPA